jgi:hypothetical protein
MVKTKPENVTGVGRFLSVLDRVGVFSAFVIVVLFTPGLAAEYYAAVIAKVVGAFMKRTVLRLFQNLLGNPPLMPSSATIVTALSYVDLVFDSIRSRYGDSISRTASIAALCQLRLQKGELETTPITGLTGSIVRRGTRLRIASRHAIRVT